MGTRGLTAAMARLLPGVSAHPESLGRRRLVLGLLVVVFAAALQTLPALSRGADGTRLAVRFAFWLFDMTAVALAVSATYNHHLARRSGSTRTLLWTLSVGGAVGSVLLMGMVWLSRRYALRLPGEPEVTYPLAAAFGVFMGVLHCGVWALAFVYPYVVDDARLRALEADKLRLEAEQLKSAAELSSLRSQLEPHFLLNTLNAIAGLVTEDPREARRLLACLGDLLRDSLADADELQSLGAEIAWLRRYAQILESRHAGALQFRWEIDAAAARAMVPRLLLQPLVENAVKHGALRRRSGGVVVVRASVTGAGEERRLVCAVEDNGPGVPDGGTREGAFGLKSVRRRLELRFPDASMTLSSSPEGTRAVVRLPADVTTLTQEPPLDREVA